ncbi:hypothetical protein DSUL_100134 [Desulfovibrionales bacterium]
MTAGHNLYFFDFRCQENFFNIKIFLNLVLTFYWPDGHNGGRYCLTLV